MKNKKGAIAIGRLLLLLLGLIVVLVVGWFAKDIFMEQAGGETRDLIASLDDSDGDGIPNDVDQCRPASCNPEGEPVNQERGNERYGCAEWQEPTPQPWAECSRRDQETAIA